MKTWSGYTDASPLLLTDCIDLIEYLKEVANIPHGQNIWDLKKIAQLVSATRLRKFGYFAVIPSIAFIGFIAATLFVLGLICAWSGETCTSEMPMPRFYVLLISASFATVGLLLAKNVISRDRRETNIMHYFSPILSMEQKRSLVDAITTLRNNNRELYAVGNYNVLRKIPIISWTAENWFLLLTQNEKNRFAIWLDGAYPKGRLYLESDRTNISTKGTGIWSKVKRRYIRHIVSDRNRLMKFIKSVENISLNEHQATWLTGLKILYDNHGIYVRYLSKNLGTKERNEFLDKLTPVFGKVSKNFKKEVSSVGIGMIDLHSLGAEGTEKFLHGRNENIDNWIKKYA